MKRLTLLLAAMGVLAGPIYAADDDLRRGARDRGERRETRRDVEQLIRDINDLAKKPGTTSAGLAEAARLAGVSLDRVQRENRDHPVMGLAGIYLALEYATRTGKPAEQFISARTTGQQSWTQIAQANNINLSEVERELSQLHSVLLSPGDRQRAERGQDLPREARGGDTYFQDTIQEVNQLGQQAEAEREGLVAIARATDLPLRRVEQAHQQHQNLGLGDLFVAQQLSAKSGKSIDELWQMHVRDKRTWADIAQQYNQDVTDLQRKLTRIEAAMSDRVPVRERERDRGFRDDRTPLTSSFQETIQQVNSLGQAPAAERAGLTAFSKEAAVSLNDIEQAHRRHQNLGLGDLFVAQELAVKSRKSIDELWRMHVDDKRTWADVAREFNVDVTDIHRKLARVETQMRQAR